jgi:hypothetical protein
MSIVPNSRIRPLNLVHPFQIIRKTDKVQKGRIGKECEVTLLYEKVMGRSSELRFFAENWETPKIQGIDAARVRRFILGFQSIPTRILRNDFVRVPWGVDPNVYAPPDVPMGFGPHIWINTPEGPLLLKWSTQSAAYVSDNLETSVTPLDGSFTLFYDGADEEVAGKIPCADWPVGFSFLRFTGPPVDYRILMIKNQLDDYSRYSYTTVQAELDESDGTPKL